mgnify:CR=1 FL=1
MVLKVTNTLTGKKEVFEPLIPGLVRMYVCGPTPYDHTHIGHARAYIVFDLIRRYLELKGYRVFHIMNITDIDDKIIRRAKELNVPWEEVPRKYTEEFLDVIVKLNIKMPHVMPKVTEHIEDIIDFVSKLMEEGYAYESHGSVYFSVDKFKDYGKLSKRKHRDEWRQEEEFLREKRKPYDFALWKKAKPGEPWWNSPWGPGRPGWHIECSVMSSKYLGEQFDIHGGGQDLIFPHHENEIAQSEACFGVKPWVKYWIHVGYLTIKGEKMSKSLGNIIPVYEVLKKYKPEVLRLYLLSSYYRSPMDFTWEGLEQAKVLYERFVILTGKVKKILRNESSPHKVNYDTKGFAKEMASIRKGFYDSMDDDFNMAKAMPYVHRFISFANKMIEQKPAFPIALSIMEFIKELNMVLGILDKYLAPTTDVEKKLNQVIETIVRIRHKFRMEKDYKTSDWIRAELAKVGVKLFDAKDKTTWVIEY